MEWPGRCCSGGLALPCYVHISLTPRFSEVQGRGYFDNRFSGLVARGQKPLKRLWLPQVSFNTQLKQGVNERVIQR
jgi:hypothetical protein